MNTRRDFIPALSGIFISVFTDIRDNYKIRQSIGEAVPPEVFFQIACRIRDFMRQQHLSQAAVGRTIEEYGLVDAQKLADFMQDNPCNLGGATLARLTFGGISCRCSKSFRISRFFSSISATSIVTFLTCSYFLKINGKKLPTPTEGSRIIHLNFSWKRPCGSRIMS